MNNNQENKNRSEEYPTNKEQQGVDKAPGEGVGKGENVSNEDLKGKKVDRDMDRPEDQPIRQHP